MRIKTNLFSRRLPAEGGLTEQPRWSYNAVALAMLTALLVGCAGYGPGNQAYWNAQFKQMCAKDGGTIVYERVQLPAEYLTKGGVIRIPAKPSDAERPLSFQAKPSDLFYYEWIHEPIASGNPAISRHTYNIVRNRDRKVLGTMISYTKTGGAIPVGDHPLTVICPDKRREADLLELVFIR